MALLDHFKKPADNGRPQWERDDDTDEVIDLPVPRQPDLVRKEVDAIRVLRHILDLGTRKGVTVYATDDSNSLEFRWIVNNVAHRYVVTFAEMKYLKMRF